MSIYVFNRFAGITGFTLLISALEGESCYAGAGGVEGLFVDGEGRVGGLGRRGRVVDRVSQVLH